MSNFISKQPSSRLGVSATHTVASSTVAAVVSSAFGAQTRQVRVAFRSAVAGDGALISIDDGTPTISSSATMIPAGTREYFTCNPGQKIAVTGATTTSAGTLSVTECS
jgi:hypothetical protein